MKSERKFFLKWLQDLNLKELIPRLLKQIISRDIHRNSSQITKSLVPSGTLCVVYKLWVAITQCLVMCSPVVDAVTE